MAYYELQPDVPGDDGDNTELDTSVHPPRVLHLHIAIDNWDGDDLITSFPAYVVTDRLGSALTKSGLGSFILRDVEISIEPEGQELLDQRGLVLPSFSRLEVTGTAGQDDIGITERGRLVTSNEALTVLRQFNLDNCDIEEYDPAQHGE